MKQNGVVHRARKNTPRHLICKNWTFYFKPKTDMKNFLPMWFFKIFVMPYCHIVMLIGETISYRERGYGLNDYEEEQFYNKYFHVCLVLGILSCALTLYAITHLIKCAL
jgi:hypothetical protein